MSKFFRLVVAFFAIICVASAQTAKKAKKSEGTSGEPLLTVPMLLDFGMKSSTLLKDTVVFTGSSVYGVVWDLIPPAQQKDVSKFIAEADKARKVNGVPTPSELWEKVTSLWSKEVLPHVMKGIETLRNVLIPLQQVLSGLVAKFEGAYPDSKGLMPTDIFDRLMVLGFIAMLLRWAVSMFCYVVCCGACAKRKDNTLQRPTKGDMSKAQASLKKRN